MSSNKRQTEVVKRKLFQYSPHKVGLALDAIRKGMKVSTASKNFNVPRTTLRHKLSGDAPETSGHVGPQAVLGIEIENELVAWIKDSARNGFPINKEGLLDSVKKIVEKGDLKTPFINNRPSRSWFEGFMTRHPDLRQKHAEYINKARALISEEKIRNWFQEVSLLLGTENLKILEDPSRVWNCDETAFFLAPKGGLVLAEKGLHVYDTSQNSDKENITTLFTVNACGEYAPPTTVYKYKRMSSEVVQNAPNGWGVGKTDKGWMTGEAFYEFVGNVFIPFLKEKGIILPIILFLDGHKSHLTMQLSKLCRENGIIVIALVPNTTHMLQPLDVAVFYPLKQNWRKLVKKWRIENDGKEITKFNLPSALHSLLISNENFANNIKAGFKTCGLYPFGPDFVNYKRIVKSHIGSKENHDVVMKLAISESSYLAYLESKINPSLLKDFYTTFESGKDWVGNKEASMLYDTWLAFKNDNTATKAYTNQPAISEKVEDPCISALHDTADNEENYAEQGNVRSDDSPHNECCMSPSLLDTCNPDDTVEEIGTQQIDNFCNAELPAHKDECAFEEPSASSSNLVPRNQVGTVKETGTRYDDYTCNLEDPTVKDDNTLKELCACSTHLNSCNQENTPLRNSEQKNTLEENKSNEDPCITSTRSDSCNQKNVSIQNVEVEKKHKISAIYTARELVKECVLYPGKKVPKQTKKAIYIPSIITSNKWVDIMEAAENEKKEKQVNKKKKSTKMKAKKKKVAEKVSSSEEDGEVEFVESGESEWNEQSDTNSNDEEIIDQTKPDNQLRIGSEQRKRKRFVTEDGSSKSELPMSQVANIISNGKWNKNLKKGCYVIIKYEGEYFPGKIDNKEGGLYEISTMVLSTGNTFRWPERPDKIWYTIRDIVEIISPPLKHNNRGFFKVSEMEKYLPSIYDI